MNMFVVEQIVGVTVVFGIAALAAWVLRKHSAASRHMVWWLAASAALLLPLASLVKPAGAHDHTTCDAVGHRCHNDAAGRRTRNKRRTSRIGRVARRLRTLVRTPLPRSRQIFATETLGRTYGHPISYRRHTNPAE